jgi:phosphate acetyltransferase
MAENLCVTATESKSGKSLISLGLMEMLLRNLDKVAFFRPLINVDSAGFTKDHDLNLISKYYKLDVPYEKMYGYTQTEARSLISQGKYEELLEGIVEKYNELEQKCDFVLCEGTDFSGSTSAFEFDINADIANNLGCPVLLVANGFNRTAKETIQAIEMSLESLGEKGCNVVCTIVNRTDRGRQNHQGDERDRVDCGPVSLCASGCKDAG